MAGGNPVSVFLRSPANGPPLRVGLLAPPAGRGSALAAALLGDLAGANYLQLVAVADAGMPRRPTAWLFEQYRRIDARYAAEPDPLAPADLVPALAALAPAGGGAPPDVWIALPQVDDAGRLAVPAAPVTATHGVWHFALGDSRRYLDDSAALAELLDGAGLTAAELRRRHADGDDEVLGRVECSTTPFPSLRLNRIAPLWSARHLLLQKLWELHALGAVRPQPVEEISAAPRAVPGNLSLGAWMCARAVRQLRARIVRPTHDDIHWKVAVRRSATPLHEKFDVAELGRFRWLESPRGTFWADPFLFEWRGDTWLFVEEMDYALGRAHISCGRLADDGTLADARPVLKLPHHLSYPQVFAEDGEIFMLPEASAGGAVMLYRATSFPGGWVADTELLGFGCVDTTVFRHRDRWWMFTSPMSVPGHAPSTWIFTADALRGPWRYHAAGPVSTSAEVARMAGNVLSQEGRLVRPSQDCGRDYGRAVLFNEVQSLEEPLYRERTLGRVCGGWWPGLTGVHTYNRAGAWEVIDGKFEVWGASVRT